jgi:hypothetical protein
MDETSPISPAPRRSFLQGFGISAAATIGAFLTAAITVAIVIGAIAHTPVRQRDPLYQAAITVAIVIGAIVLASFGIAQLAWNLPLYFHYSKQGNREAAKGVLLTIGITFLLSAACWGALMNAVPRRL